MTLLDGIWAKFGPFGIFWKTNYHCLIVLYISSEKNEKKIKKFTSVNLFTVEVKSLFLEAK